MVKLIRIHFISNEDVGWGFRLQMWKLSWEISIHWRIHGES